jgi:uncharacterized membrane protein YbaN (DUF454 family)
MDVLLVGIGFLLVAMGSIGYVLSDMRSNQKTIIAKQDAIMAKLIEIKHR